MPTDQTEQVTDHKLKCTNSGCGEDATRVMAMPPVNTACHFAAPYCDQHAAEVKEMGGLPVSGPALSEQAQKIGGVR